MARRKTQHFPRKENQITPVGFGGELAGPQTGNVVQLESGNDKFSQFYGMMINKKRVIMAQQVQNIQIIFISKLYFFNLHVSVFVP